MDNYTRIIGATSTNIRTPTAPEINQGNDLATLFDTPKNNGYNLEMSQQIAAISAELTNYLIDRGVAPDSGDLTQFLQAINIDLTSAGADAASQGEVDAGVVSDKFVAPSTLLGLFAASSQAANGYVRIPVNIGGAFDEIIIQWGTTVSIGSGATVATVFPLAFTTNCLSISHTRVGTTATFDGIECTAKSAASFSLRNANNATQVYWIAIGY